MTGFLRQLADRARGVERVAELRRPSPYEPGGSAPVVAARPRPVRLPASLPVSAPAEPTAAPDPDPSSAPATVFRPLSPEVRSVRSAEHPVPDDAATSSTVIGAAAAGPATAAEPSRLVASTPAAAADALGRDERPDAREERDPATEVPALAEPIEQPGGESANDPPPEPAATPQVAVPDTEVLVREHIVPVLVEREVVPGDAEARFAAPDRPHSRPARGQVVISTSRPEAMAGSTRMDGASEPPTPQVHVHIDRVEVVRPAAERPARPAPARPARPQVDHVAYLARRRGEG